VPNTRRIRVFVPTLVWSAFLLVVSLTPSDDMPRIDASDKLGHFIFYLVQTILTARAFYKWNSKNSVLQSYLIGALFALIFGGVLELIQEFQIPGRSGDWYDFGANVLGILAAYPFLRRMCRQT
jgi:VanZ family protein